jgi:outer membrane protein, heavy metal efflux system
MRQSFSIGASTERMSRSANLSHLRLLGLLVCAALGACAIEPYVPATLDAETVPLAIATAGLDDEPHRVLLAEFGLAEPWPPKTWTLEQLGLLAIYRSHAVGAAQAAVTAASAAQTVAARGPNPSVNLGVAHSSERDPGDSSKWSIGPNFAYLWSPVDRGRIRAALAGTAVVSARAAVLEQAWGAWHLGVTSALKLVSERQQRELLEAHAQALEVAVDAARKQVAGGVRDSIDWQLLKLDANSARIERLARVARVNVAGTTLAGALSIPLAALDGIALAPGKALLPPDYAEIQRQTLTTHSAVLAALAAYDKAERDLELAVAEQYPEIALNPGYLFDQGDNVWSLVGGVVVPLLGYHQASIASAAAERDAARARFEAVQAETIARVQTAWGRWQAAAAALTEAASLANEMAANQRELARQLTDGLVDPVTVALAEVQRAQLAVRLNALESRRLQALIELEFTARTALADSALGRYLDKLYAGGASQ